MKSFLIKGAAALLSGFIFINIVIVCMSGAKRLDYMNVEAMAQAQAENIKPVTNPPGQSYETADESLLKNDDGPFTAEDFSYMVIDGIRIDMPCTFGELAEHFDMAYHISRDRLVVYVCKDNVPFMNIRCDKGDSKPPYSDCVADEIGFRMFLDFSNRALLPEIIVGGIDITQEDFSGFQALEADGGEYKTYLTFETEDNRYICILDGSAPTIRYYDSYDEMPEE